MKVTRVALLLSASVSLFSSRLLAQTPPEVPSALAADVVVTAEAAPEKERTLGVAATVIDRAEIERSKKTSVLELLRTVPGLDVVQSGGPGGVASLFLRGTNSTQTLVLLDGVKVNSPFFGAFDLATLSTADVERIEVVRGPFSALYGSEAIGGVVQVFTKRNASGVDAAGTFAAGSLSAREGTARASFGNGPFTFTAGFRRTTTDGDLPNAFFAATNAAAAADLTSGAFRVGVTFRRDESRSGVPFSGATATPRQFTTAETTAVSVPVSLSLGASTTLEAAATYTKDRPAYSNVDDPYGFTFSKTEAGRAGGRITLVTTLGGHRISIGTDYERTRVDNEDAFGVEIDGKTTRTISAFAEDRVSLFGEKL
ncbi:MAG TPA: TonB-dependent receptor plug domain-containing protein, partial [Thermoanaerobaculia bacterium]|nr:TonB-dependent receptor plug domain-containing protein [Thermoanaerobaculia bacterium]